MVGNEGEIIGGVVGSGDIEGTELRITIPFAAGDTDRWLGLLHRLRARLQAAHLLRALVPPLLRFEQERDVQSQRKDESER
jgi:hypothetical protein